MSNVWDRCWASSISERNCKEGVVESMLDGPERKIVIPKEQGDTVMLNTCFAKWLLNHAVVDKETEEIEECFRAFMEEYEWDWESARYFVANRYGILPRHVQIENSTNDDVSVDHDVWYMQIKKDLYTFRLHLGVDVRQGYGSFRFVKADLPSILKKNGKRAVECDTCGEVLPDVERYSFGGTLTEEMMPTGEEEGAPPKDAYVLFQKPEGGLLCPTCKIGSLEIWNDSIAE